MEKEPCELLIKAKSLAIRRGLDDTKVECPFIDVCKGTRCYLFNGNNTEENHLIYEDLKGNEGEK